MSAAAAGRKVEASLVVDSDNHTVAELVAVLGMLPDESWEKGAHTLFAGKQRTRSFTRWAVTERDAGVTDWRNTVQRLVDRLMPHVSKFGGLPVGVSVKLQMFITEDNGVFGFGLDRHQIAFLSSINAELDLSFVVAVEVVGD